LVKKKNEIFFEDKMKEYYKFLKNSKIYEKSEHIKISEYNEIKFIKMI
jgi:hypothetical protein